MLLRRAMMIKKEAERLELEKRKYIKGRFKELEEYRDEVWHCSRCNMCKEVFGWYMKSAEFSGICPSFLSTNGMPTPPRGR